jgi:hypothetical protein
MPVEVYRTVDRISDRGYKIEPNAGKEGPWVNLYFNLKLSKDAAIKDLINSLTNAYEDGYIDMDLFDDAMNAIYDKEDLILNQCCTYLTYTISANYYN